MNWKIRASHLAILTALLTGTAAHAQDTPYFVAYSHHLEEPGNLEVEFNPQFSTQTAGRNFTAATTSFEYGVRAWWTSELYLDGQHTFGEGTAFTGWRWENRWRVLQGEHPVNPVLYLEYENISEAEKSMIEVVGFDTQFDHASPLTSSRHEWKRELEGKLILSSDIRGWNFSENLIAERNLAHGNGMEYGYAAGASRPLAMSVSARDCNVCAENFRLGVEFYGGLGTADDVKLQQTSHYAAAILGWYLPNGVRVRVSPGFGLNRFSHPFVLRAGITYEFENAGSSLRRLFR